MNGTPLFIFCKLVAKFACIKYSFSPYPENCQSGQSSSRIGDIYQVLTIPPEVTEEKSSSESIVANQLPYHTLIWSMVQAFESFVLKLLETTEGSNSGLSQISHMPWQHLLRENKSGD